MTDERRAAAIDWVYTGLRIVAGWVFLQHGAQKLFGVLGGFGPNGGTAPLMSQFGLAGVIEFFGGTLILLGLLTRGAAFISSGEMAWAYFQAHAPRALFWTVLNHGELPAILAFLFLYFSLRGAGPYSLDAMLGRMRGRTTAAETPGTAGRG